MLQSSGTTVRPLPSHVPNHGVQWFISAENCAPPTSTPGYDVVNNIRQVAHEYGSVKLFKAYLELSEQSSSKSIGLRSELQSCGVSLTDCPHNGRKDVADKMMIGMSTIHCTLLHFHPHRSLKFDLHSRYAHLRNRQPRSSHDCSHLWGPGLRLRCIGTTPPEVSRCISCTPLCARQPQVPSFSRVELGDRHHGQDGPSSWGMGGIS